MADNQRVLKKNADDGFLAEDDPLAELARIVNFDLPVTPSRARISTPRREPEFNLEDELLKGLEQYEVGEDSPAAPASALQAPFVAPAVDHDVRYSAQPMGRETWAEPAFAPVQDEPVAYAPVEAVEPGARSAAEPAYIPSPAEPVFDAAPQPRLDPVGRSLYDLEEEIMQEFAAFDARRTEPARAAPVEPVFSRREPELPVYEPVQDSFAPSAQHSAEAEAWRLEDADFAATFASLDIDAEPEADARYEEPQDLVEPVWDEADDFPADTLVEALEDELHRSMADSTDLAEPVDAHVDEGDRAEPHFASWSTPSVDPSALDDDAFWRQPAAGEPVAEVEPVRETPSTADAMALDRLLADVERYPVVTRSGWSRSTSFGTAGEKLVAPAAASPALRAPEVAPAAAPVAVPAAPLVAPIAAPDVALVQPVARKDVVETSEEDDFPLFSDADLFDENAFELDLREIELDLLDVMDDAPAAKPAAAVPAPKPIDDSYPAVENIVKPAREAPVVIDAAPVKPDVADLASLPFDPTQISVEEDALEALAEIDVPELPVVDHEPASTDPADYDLDIDADMAEFFAARPEPAATVLPSRSTGRVETAAPAAAAADKATGDFDEFEKALEEDFRRSLSENRATVNLDRVALSPVDVEEVREDRGRSRRILVLAASVVGVALLGGAGVYAFMGGAGGLVASSGEPKIILADKEPMKVAPENPGGQKVPNQDKAVYDRVSGTSSDQSKQPRLVTSNEEPVDVVQKTLMPENLPMDDEQDAMGTPTEDTTDARLLPEGATENVSTSEKVATGVAPRKVRTMIVRPDGSLVPREEIVSETAAATPDAPAVAAQPTEVPERLPPDDISRTIEQASADPTVGQEQTARSVEPAAAETQPAVDNETDAAETTTDAPADGGVSADQAAIAAASQADVPSATETADTAPVEAAPAQATPAEAEVASAPVNTPVPSSRPAEQPVNVIGAVSDQGRVTDGQPSETETASAQPQAEAPVAQTPTPAGSYVIQIASLPSQSDAETSYKRLSVKFAGVIGGRGVDIKRADIANKGTYYRVRIPAGSKQEAQDLCARYKAAGGSCLVSK